MSRPSSVPSGYADAAYGFPGDAADAAELAEVDYDAWWDCPLVLCGAHPSASCPQGGAWAPGEDWVRWVMSDKHVAAAEENWRDGDETVEECDDSDQEMQCNAAADAEESEDKPTPLDDKKTPLQIVRSKLRAYNTPNANAPTPVTITRTQTRGVGGAKTSTCLPKGTLMDPVGADEAWFLVRAWAEGVRHAQEAHLRDSAVKVARQMRAKAVWEFRRAVRDVDTEIDACADRLVEQCVE